MPRGRPPLPRTKEEALTARREQIRRNVQAFRARKQAWKASDEVHTYKNKDSYTFVPEEVGQFGSGDRSQRLPVEREVLQPGTTQCKDESPLSTLIQDVSKRNSRKSLQGRVITNPNHGFLPPHVDSRPAALQQFTSNVVCTFSPDDASTTLHWSQLMPSLVNRTETLDLSIRALCLLQISHANLDNYALSESISHYNHALKSLQRALTQPTDRFSLEIFAAAQALGSYELFRGIKSQSRGWMLHFEGALAYLTMFRSLDVSALNHQLSFHFLETICIFDALGSRRPSFLSGSRWWRDSVDRFGGKTYAPLLRMLTSLSEVLEQCDHAVNLELPPKATEELKRVLRICLRLENAFLHWFYRTLARDGSQSEHATTIPVSLDLTGSMDVQWETTDNEMTFSDIYSARLHLLYWSSMILLYDSIIAIVRRLNSDFSTCDPISRPITKSINALLSPKAYKSSSNSFAISILRSAAFCMKPKHGFIGKSLILLPLCVARGYLRCTRDEAKIKRCDEWLEMLGQKEMHFGLRINKGP